MNKITEIILAKRDNHIYVLFSEKKYNQTFGISRFHLKSFFITPFESNKFPRVEEMQLPSNSEDYRGKTFYRLAASQLLLGKSYYLNETR